MESKLYICLCGCGAFYLTKDYDKSRCPMCQTENQSYMELNQEAKMHARAILEEHPQLCGDVT